MITLIVLAKQPRPGRVKTRLTPPLSPEQAAAVAAAALRDTLRVAERIPARRRVLAFDGDVRAWSRPGWKHRAQPAGGLDERIVAGFAAGRGSAVLVGMDTPQLRPDHIRAFDPDRYDACLGPATDGGFWCLGFADARMAGAAVAGIPMSTEHTGARQLDRLRELGLRVQLLDTLTDVDTIDSALDVAAAAPDTRFAAALRDILVGV